MFDMVLVYGFGEFAESKAFRHKTVILRYFISPAKQNALRESILARTNFGKLYLFLNLARTLLNNGLTGSLPDYFIYQRGRAEARKFMKC